VEKATLLRLLACSGTANTRSRTLPSSRLMLLRKLSSPFTNFGQIDGRCLTLFPRGQGSPAQRGPANVYEARHIFSCSSRTPGRGNIRELRNVIERSIIVCETEIFTVDESWLSQRPLDMRSGSDLLLSEKVAATERGRRLRICTRGYLLSAGLRRAGSSRISRRAVAQ